MIKVKLNGESITPSKVVCVGRNYVAHIKELNNEMTSEPVIFLKPNSAISAELVLAGTDEIHFESELSFVVSQGEIVAVGLGLDLTKRPVQNELKQQGLPWERAKAFDGSAVFSEFVEIDCEVPDLSLELHLNGQLQQQGGCKMMLHSPAALIKHINEFITLNDGDILMTGTPAGVGQLNAGDELIGKVFCNEDQLLEVTWKVDS